MTADIGGLRKVAVMAGIAAFAAVLLSLVHGHTRPLIAHARQAEKEWALELVLPEFENRPLATARPVELEDGGGEALLYTATRGGEIVGRALELVTTEGYGPRIDLLVGADIDGAVTGVYILGHQETPGLGAKVTYGQNGWKKLDSVSGRPFLIQFRGASLGAFDFRVRSDGGQVDAITASTITSRAVARAIERALVTMTAATETDG